MKATAPYAAEKGKLKFKLGVRSEELGVEVRKFRKAQFSILLFQYKN